MPFVQDYQGDNLDQIDGSTSDKSLCKMLLGLFSTHDAYDMIVAIIGNHPHPKGKVSFGGRDKIQWEAKELNLTFTAFTCW